MAKKLTERVIKALAPPRRGSRLIWDAELTGFALRLYAPTKAHPKGARTFFLSYWRDGIERRLRIGSWPDWSVTAARAEARELRRRIDRGEEVASDRRKRREAPTMAGLGKREQEPRNGEQSQCEDGAGRFVKAVVFPTIALPALQIPPWVPGAVARSARAKYAEDVHLVFSTVERKAGFDADVDELADEARDQLADKIRNQPVLRNTFVSITELFQPLVCDPRMRGVWRELCKLRADGAFLHPARGAWWERRMPFLLPADARERQEEAMVELFDVALACQQRPRTTTMTRRQAEQQRDYYLTKAQELQLDATTMLTDPASQRHKRHRRLLEAVQAYEDYAHETYAAAIRTSLDRQRDGRARWVALTISNKFRVLFGSPMYRLTAAITSVVLGRNVSRPRIRQWCHGADSSRKNGP
jgi:Arm domain-containing DNA-binding protein